MESEQEQPLASPDRAREALESEMEQALAYLKGVMDEGERAAFEASLARSEPLRAEVESGRALLDTLQAASEEAIAHNVNACIERAIRANASDIHIVSEPPATVVYFRIGGVLRESERLPGAQHSPWIDRWKGLAGCRVTERQAPQHGRISVRQEERNFELRVTFLPTITGERITARILLLDMQALVPSLDALGFGTTQREAIQRLLARPHGLVLATGMAGSGKTTLLYALLQALQSSGTERRNILTLEDPVEFRLPGISQTALNREAGMTFATGLRGIFQSDPDVVLCSEIRDAEVAELAVEIAHTGHLMLSSLPVSSALDVIPRLRALGVPALLLAKTLGGATAQRLMRRVCKACATEYEPSPDALQQAGLSLLEDGPFLRGAGCAACRGTGLRGRVALFEVLEVDEALQSLIAADAALETLWSETFGRNGDSLWDYARALIRQGVTTVEEAAWALYDYPRIVFESAEAVFVPRRPIPPAGQEL